MASASARGELLNEQPDYAAILDMVSLLDRKKIYGRYRMVRRRISGFSLADLDNTAGSLESEVSITDKDLISTPSRAQTC
jgi:hypothetical protein